MDISNPFNITKAVDLTDAEIENYWVDIAPREGFAALLKPRSPMPMLILGGKGSGKTHLMRYFSYRLQKLRHGGDVPGGVHSDGFLGVYFRCGGLNSARFSGKGQQPDIWEGVFAYFVELWLAQLLLGIVLDMLPDNEETRRAERVIINEARVLFDEPLSDFPTDLQGLMRMLARLQKQVDIAVNNCGLQKSLDVRIRVTPGRLVFGLPRLLSDHLPMLQDVQIVYLVDEFENLSESQQRHVNTLLRERETPCTFKIGARLYGVKTYSTYSAEEENKEGSEFEVLRLDALLRLKKKQYSAFSNHLCIKRLEAADYSLSGTEDLDSWFVSIEPHPFAAVETAEITEKYEGSERPCLVALRRKLDATPALWATGTLRHNVTRVVEALRCAPYPLLEKLNTFLLYKAWYQGLDLEKESEAIRAECTKYMDAPEAKGLYAQVLSHFRSDLMAQLLRECGMKQRYLGFDTFVAMSGGLPRDLLIILKHIVKWAIFNGEEPFKKSPISARSQQAGVQEAAEWFFRDSRVAGTDGTAIRDSIGRLATLFREMRYADKPTECSLCTFSAEVPAASREAQRVIDLAAKWSLLIETPGGRRDRNTERVDVKYQLNPMLAPRWDLPVYRRAVIAFNAHEVNAIFDKERSSDFEETLRARVARMTAPRFGKRLQKCRANSRVQSALPELGDD